VVTAPAAQEKHAQQIAFHLSCVEMDRVVLAKIVVQIVVVLAENNVFQARVNQQGAVEDVRQVVVLRYVVQIPYAAQVVELVYLEKSARTDSV